MSPKSLDPISRRPKPEGGQAADAKPSAPLPHTADRDQLLEKAQFIIQDRKNQNAARRRKIVVISLLALLALFVIGSLALWKYGPKLPGAKYAYVGGKDNSIRVEQKTADDIKRAFEAKAQKEKASNIDPVQETKKQIAVWAALKNLAQEKNVQCTDIEIQDYLRSQRKITTSIEDYYIANEQAGKSRDATNFQDESECLQSKLKNDLITQREYSALSIRWDYFWQKNGNKVDADAEQKIRDKFEQKYIPLYKANATLDQLAAASDLNYQQSKEQQQAILLKDDGYASSFVLYKNLLDSKTQVGFKQYPTEGESNYPYLEKLKKAGDYSPVFKSNTGYYVIFRLESVKPGKYSSYDEMMNTYLKDIRLSWRAELHQAGVVVMAKLKNIFIKVAKAATDCLLGEAHRITYFTRISDSSTDAAINGVILRASTDRATWLCNPVNGVFRGDMIGSSGPSFVGPSWYNQTVADTIEHNQNVFGFISDAFDVDCNGPSWRFLIDTSTIPAGYTFTNAPGTVRVTHNCIYFCDEIQVTQGFFGGQPYFDVPFSKGINGDFFTLQIKLERTAPPTFSVGGRKLDRYSDPWGGNYSGATIRDNSTGDMTNAQPYSLPNRVQTQEHQIRAWDTADWVATGFRYGTTQGTPAAFGIPAGSAPVNSNVNIDFFYEPRPSTIQTGILVRDPSDGQLKNPCTVSGVLSYLCDNPATITTTRNFNLPNGLVNSFSNLPTYTTTPNRDNGGIFSLTNLYANSTAGNPAAAGYRVDISVLPAGYRIAGTVTCPERTNPADCFNSVTPNGGSARINVQLSANSSRPVYFILEQAPFNLRIVKRAPGTFVNGNSDTQDLGYGQITLNNSTILSREGRGGGSTPLLYNGANQTVRAEAPAGWQIRGYSFCIGQAFNQPSCDVGAGNDQTQADGAQDQTNGTMAKIITQNNGQQSLELQINTSGLKPTFNGQTIDPALWNKNELYIAFYFKPAPVKYQARSLIHREGPDTGYRTNLNPCAITNTSDYKYQALCRNVEFRAVRNVLQPTGPVSRNYVPTLPGYGYSVVGSHNQTTGNCSLGSPNSCTAGASDWIKPGKRLVGPGNAVDDATAQSENLAIFDNLYPGNYVIQYNNESFPSKTSWGDLSYSVLTSNCDDGTSNCSDAKPRRAMFGYCPINFAFGPITQPGYAYKDDYLPGELRWYANCRNDFGSPREGINGISATPNFNQLTQYGIFSIIDPPPYCVGGFFLIWCTGYWVDPPPQANNPNNQDYSFYTEDRALNVGLRNGYAEANFMWTPRPEITNVNIDCEQITANIVYSPDPNRTVRTYITLDGQEVRKPDGTRVEATSRQGVPAVFNIPTRQFYNQTGPNQPPATVWKDGMAHRLKFWTIYEDGDLQAPTRESVTITGQARRYDPVNPNVRPQDAVKPDPANGNYTYRCRNQATCDVDAFKAATDAYAVTNTGATLNITVRMQNTGQSYWWKDRLTGSAPEPSSIPVDTKHTLGAGAGMRLESAYGDYGWRFSNIELDRAESSNRFVRPTAVEPSDTSMNTVVFTFSVVAPAQAVDGSTLSFAMYRDGNRFGTEVGDSASIECSTTIRVRGDYSPWLRVQNGSVGALGKVQNQPEGDRGTYKALNDRTSTMNPSWFAGTQQLGPNMPRVGSLNYHAQYTVAAAAIGEALNSKFGPFCSTNFYSLGRTTPNQRPSQVEKGCKELYASDLNMETVIKNSFSQKKQGTDNTIFAAALANYEINGQCNDEGTTPNVDDGPNPLSPIKQYYRSWAPGGSSEAPGNLVINQPDLTSTGLPNGYFGRYPDGSLKLVHIQNNMQTGPQYARPCPTIYKLSTFDSAIDAHTLGGGSAIKIGAGRSLLVVSGNLKITNDIVNSYQNGNALDQKYDFKQGAAPNNTIDLAGLNKVPNLGIMVDGDILIDSSVKEIHANLFATGTLITCDKYVLQGDTGTTGTKNILPQNADPLDKNNPLSNEPPNADNATASQCANRLTIKGSVAASRYAFGRNFVDFEQMVRNFTNPAGVPNALNYPIGSLFISSTPNTGIADRKFCNRSNNPTVLPLPPFTTRRICFGANGERIDFDAPGTYNGDTQNYLAINGYPQSNYFGGPAEDFIGSGLSFILPPPGFENIATDSFTRPKYVQQNAKPKF